jgi:hypothetical protein
VLILRVEPRFLSRLFFRTTTNSLPTTGPPRFFWLLDRECPFVSAFALAWPLRSKNTTLGGALSEAATSGHAEATMRESALRKCTLVAMFVPLLSGLPSAHLNAQPQGLDRIALGPLELSLGDEQGRTLEKLRTRYTLEKPHSNEVIDAMAGPDEEVWTFVGANDSGRVFFSHGKISLVIHKWAPKSPTALALGQELMNMFDGLLGNGVKACKLVPRWAPDATGARSYGIVFVCGNTNVTWFLQGDVPLPVSIVETLTKD